MELSETYGENASVGIGDGDELLYVDTAMAPGAVQVSDWTGRHVPFHADAAGLMLMAGWTADEFTKYTNGNLATPTKRTVIGTTELLARTAEAKEAGFVWTYGEFSKDVNGIAAPVESDGQIIGAVNIYGPAYRWPGDRDLDAIAADLMEICHRISARFAGDE